MKPAPDPLLGQDVGGYIVEEVLGEGGMGLVYRARHPILNRHFAIKVLRPEVAHDDDLSGHFMREAQTLSSLKHPNIIDIVGFGQLDAQRQYMVMEFLEGRTLEAELMHGPLLPDRALAVADQVLDALVAAHSVEVVHRDLKPSNVFLSRMSGGSELVKLLDFGLARQAPVAMDTKTSGPLLASVAAGTPEYVAPEQARGLSANKHSDLYSFGVVLFEMLVGERPFRPAPGEQDPVRRLLTMHAKVEAPLLSTASSVSMPPELEALVADLLKKKPEERPSSAQTARARLQQVRRALQQQETQQRRNPLLELSEPAASPVKSPSPRALPLPPSVDPLPELALQRRSGKAWLLGLGLMLALAGSAWWLRSPAEAAPVAEPAPPPPPSAAVEPTPAPPPPVVTAPPPAEADELQPLGALAPPRAKKIVPKKAPPTAGTVMLEVSRATCEPNDRWRQAARTHLQELQQAAASASDPGAWTRFEKAESSLTASIGRASTGADCEAVDRAIEQLARTYTP